MIIIIHAYVSHELIVRLNRLEFDTIYLQEVKSGHQVTSYLDSFNFVSLK